MTAQDSENQSFACRDCCRTAEWVEYGETVECPNCGDRWSP